MSDKFGLYYIGEDGERHTPVVMHSVAFGAIERFLAILIEHFAGAFPLWLAPVQVKVMPITDRVHDYATSVYQTLFDAGLRVELDDRNEKIGFKIREAQLAKIPYMLVVGDREAEAGVVAVRHRERGDLGTMDLHQLIEELQEAIVSKRIS